MDPLVLSHAAEARLGAGDQRDAGVDREIPSLVQVDHTFVVELVDDGALDREIGEAGPAAVGDLGVSVLGGVKPDHAGLETERQVLGDEGDVESFASQVVRDGEDAVVVGLRSQCFGQWLGGGVVELDANRAAVLVDRQLLEERRVSFSEFLETSKRGPCRPSEFRMVAFGFQFGQDDQRKNDGVFLELSEGLRFAQQDRCVEDVGTT